LFSLELVKWIQTTCLNIHTLTLKSFGRWFDLNVDFDRLKNLKELHVNGLIASNLKVVTFLTIPKIETLLTSSKIFRKCRQVQILRVSVLEASLHDFVELELAGNFTEVHLSWGSGPSFEEVLPVIKRWRHLSRLTLHPRSFPRFQVVCSFIMELKNLIYFHFIPDSINCSRRRWETLRDKVNQVVLPQRPNFEFDISRRTRL
jgi:hypothetical protein